MPKIKVNDINVYYEIHGDGTPLVMITGLGGNLDFWSPVLLDDLSKSFKTIIFDNRGVGRTDKPDIPYSVKMMADDTIDLMDALNIKRAHVLGHSFGGKIAQEIVLTYPERVENLVLGSTNCGGSKAILPPAELLQTLSEDKEGLTVEEVMQSMVPLLYTEDTIKNKPELIEEEFRRFLKIRTPNYSINRQMVASGQFRSCRRLKNINTPTLVMHGKKDILVPPQNAEILTNLIPGAKLVLFDNAAHDFFADNPEKSFKTLIGFLK